MTCRKEKEVGATRAGYSDRLLPIKPNSGGIGIGRSISRIFR